MLKLLNLYTMARLFLRNCRILLLEQQKRNATVIQLLKYSNACVKSEKESEADHPSTLYVNKSVEYTSGKKVAVRKLQELFNLRPFKAADIVTRYKSLCLVLGKTMSDNYALLKSEGVEDSTILECPELLAQRNLAAKIDELKQLPYCIKDTAPLLSLKARKLTQLIKKLLIDGNRLERMANLLEVPIVQVCGFYLKRPFLQGIPMRKVETNVKLLTGFGITTDEIKKDFWVLQYKSDVVEQRLQIARELKVDKLKTWMVRSKAEIFNTHVQRISDNKLILGESSVAEYLSKRLECSESHMKLILSKHPALLKKSVKKMSEIIDFLISDGFTPHHIARNPKVLLHSVETTKKRLKELESLELKVDSLHVLTKSQKQYLLYYDNLIKCGRSKVNDTD